MAKILLHSVQLEASQIEEWMLGAYYLLKASAGLNSSTNHTLVSDPEDADLIIFAELGAHGMFAERVRRHPYVKRFRDKCFLFDPCDYALPFLPGVYASLRKKYYDATRTRPGFYLRIDENPYLDFRPPRQDYKYLASFVGSIGNHPMRAELLRLPKHSFAVEDTTSIALKLLYGAETEERHRFWSHYAEVISSAPFAICPRGKGPGSVRLFEVMQMGRVPVILSDEWVYPARVDWRACSISVPEKEMGRLPEIIGDYRARADEMGRNAREEWEKYYAPSARFHWLVEDCLEMLKARRVPEAIAGRLVWRHLFDYRTFRLYLNSKKAIYRETGKIVL